MEYIQSQKNESTLPINNLNAMRSFPFFVIVMDGISSTFYST